MGGCGAIPANTNELTSISQSCVKKILRISSSAQNEREEKRAVPQSPQAETSGGQSFEKFFCGERTHFITRRAKPFKLKLRARREDLYDVSNKI